MHTSQISTSAYTPKCAHKHTLQGELTLRDAPAQAHTRLSHLPTFSSSISQFLSPALSPRPSPPTSYRHSDALWHHRMVEKCVHVSAQHRGRGRDSLRKWPRSLVCESRETLARVKSSLQAEFLATGLMFLLNLKTGSTNQITGLLTFEKTCGADTRETEGKSSSSWLNVSLDVLIRSRYFSNSVCAFRGHQCK